MRHSVVFLRPRSNFQNFLVRTLLFSVAACLFFVGAAAGQKQKKKKNQDAKTESSVIPPLPDDRAIDLAISEMLGAWQIGDTERLHQHYDENVVVISGTWDPPVVGWNKYLQAYQAQRQRVQGVRLDRFNTVIKVDGKVGWASYQWKFTAIADSSPRTDLGQTTLILEKRKDQWIIVHNHTSLVQQMTGTQPAAPATPAPQKPPELR
ncbi:MAG TPA: nuclear transport factor 2 family protein [Candidatus Acidoferrales bacterium]|nr:nuclear transport factor 2 family protein [Candidatus Acidoferrales bacterium]